MDLFQTFIIVLIVLVVSVAGLATNILLKKNGQFPNTHVGSNPNMIKKGLICAKRFDAQEQAAAKKKDRYKNLKMVYTPNPKV